MWWRSQREKQLEERVERAERALASLKSDFLELEDKAYRWMQRAVQRSKREASEPDRFDLANQQIDPISRELHRRRAMMQRRSEPSDTTDRATSSETSLEPLVPLLPTSR
jgi:hypothetical protein